MSRVALYIDANHSHMVVTAVRAARQAQRDGDRVVTMVRETTRSWRLSTGRRPALKRLLSRMAAGEFEAIVLASTPDDALGAMRLSFQEQLSQLAPEEMRI